MSSLILFGFLEVYPCLTILFLKMSATWFFLHINGFLYWDIFVTGLFTMERQNLPSVWRPFFWASTLAVKLPPTAHGKTHQFKWLPGPGGPWVKWARWWLQLLENPCQFEGHLLAATECRPSCWSSSFPKKAVSLDFYVQLQGFAYRNQIKIKKGLMDQMNPTQITKPTSTGFTVAPKPVLWGSTNPFSAPTGGLGLTWILGLVVSTVLELNLQVSGHY